MTAQKLYETLKLLDDLDRNYGLQRTLASIRDALNNLVNQPAAPAHQSALASALAAFTTSAAKMAQSITPSQAALIDSMGGAEYFDPSIAERVKNWVAMNAMTPSVARDSVQDLTARREEFLNIVKNTLQGLKGLKITEPRVEPGSVDMAFLIPRNLFDNELGMFAKELTFINSLVRDVSEAKTGQAEPTKLKELSSSNPAIALAAASAVVLAIATAVEKFLDVWKKIEEIREIRQKAANIGVKTSALEELDKLITTKVELVVEESTIELLAEYKGQQSRKNELSNALTQDISRLFGQIERGLTLEFHAEPKKDAPTEEQKALDSVSALGREIKFPQITSQPLLLMDGHVVEGPITEVKVSAKRVVHKVSKQETHKDIKSEPKEDS
jgi:hypothetical protein